MVKIKGKRLHKVIERASVSVGNASILALLWIIDKKPNGVISEELALGRGVNRHRANRYLQELNECGYLIQDSKRGDYKEYSVNIDAI